MNLCLSLITQGMDDTAFQVLKHFPTLQPDVYQSDALNLGNFFLRHCVNVDVVGGVANLNPVTISEELRV